MFKQTYTRLFDGIAASEEIRARTRSAIARGQRPRRNPAPRCAIAALGLAACALVLFVSGAIPGLGGKNRMNQNPDTVHMIMGYQTPPSSKLYFDPQTTRSETWNLAQSLAFLGRDPRPATLPANLSPLDADAQFVILGEDDAMVHGVFRFEYSDRPDDPHAASARYLGIEVSKDGLSPTCLRYLADEATRSVISGVEVALGAVEQPVYGDDGEATGESLQTCHAEFMHDGLGYRVHSRGLTQAEFLEAIRALVG